MNADVDVVSASCGGARFGGLGRLFVQLDGCRSSVRYRCRGEIERCWLSGCLRRAIWTALMNNGTSCSHTTMVVGRSEQHAVYVTQSRQTSNRRHVVCDRMVRVWVWVWVWI